MKQTEVLLIGGDNHLKQALLQHRKIGRLLLLHPWVDLSFMPDVAAPHRLQNAIICFTNCAEAKQLTQTVQQRFPQLSIFGFCDYVDDKCLAELVNKGMDCVVFATEIDKIPNTIHEQGVIKKLPIQRNLQILHHPLIEWRYVAKKPLEELTQPLPKKLRSIVEILLHEKTYTALNLATVFQCKVSTIRNQLRTLYVRLNVKDKDGLLQLLEEYEAA